MALERWEFIQRQNGNQAGAEAARVLREQYGDVPLTTIETEAPENQRFSKEAKETLEARGFKIYELTGQSIKTLRDQGHPFWSTWHKDYPDFEDLASRSSEVAIDSKHLFISRSNNKTLGEQVALVAKFDEELQIPGARAILGEASDYVELAFTHLDKTGERLFGKKYDYNYTRTQTRVEGDVAVVGSFGADRGLDVYSWDPALRRDFLFAAPLVVPAGIK